MELTQAIQERRSIRKYAETPLSQNLIERVIQAGLYAPSAKNRQPWRFVVVQEAAKAEMLNCMQRGLQRELASPILPQSKHYLAGAKHTASIMEQAPVTIFVINPLNDMACHDFEARIYDLANVQAVGACIQNILLAAVDSGLGGLWNCDIFFAYPELNKWLGGSGQMVAAVCLGIPGEKPSARTRYAINDVVEWR